MPENDAMNRFLQTFFNIADMKRQQAALDLQDRMAHQAALHTFMTDAAQTARPAEQNTLANAYAKFTGLDPSMMSSILSSVQPNVEALRGQAIQQGVAAMGPEQSGQLNNLAALAGLAGTDPGRAAIGDMTAQLAHVAQNQSPDFLTALSKGFATSHFANQNLGDFAISEQVAGLPQAQKEQAAGVATGTALSSRDIQQNEQFNKELAQRRELTLKSLAQEKGIAYSRLQLDKILGAQQGSHYLMEYMADMNRVQANQNAGGSDHLAGLMATQTSIMGQLKEAAQKGAAPPIIKALKQAYNRTQREIGIIQGLPPEETARQMIPEDENMYNFSPLEGLLQGWKNRQTQKKQQ